MILGVVRRIFGFIAVGFLLYLVWDSRESLVETIRSGDSLRLMAAVIAWSVMHLMSPALSTVIFRARACPLSYQAAADIHISNLPARYLPGGIWHTVGRIAGFKRLGIGRRDIAIFVFLENALAVGVAFVLGGSVVAWYQDMEGWGLGALFAAAGGLTLLLLAPLILSHRVVKGDLGFKLQDYIAGIGVVALSWCIGAAAFILYVTAFPDLGLRTSPLETGGIYLFSWGTGFVSIFAPQGIGVFEVVAGELLGGAGPLKTTVALLVGFRLVILVADGLTWLAQQALYGLGRWSNETG